MSQSGRTDVFTEAPEGSVPAGYADLVIKASIKIPLEGYYALGSKTSIYEKEGYHFLINIDGQAVLWKVAGQKETIPLYDEMGGVSQNPDAGAGMKYILERKIRIAVGQHKIFFGLPAKPYSTKVRLTLKEGESPVLELKPRYRYKTMPTRIPSFLEGIAGYEILLNGHIIR
jgi:hypothetical protein